MKRSTFAILLFLLAMPGFIRCGLTHICMCGHLQHVLPGTSDYYREITLDILWIIPLAMAGIMGLISEARPTRILGLLAALLGFSRLVLQSGGGYGLICMELPVLLTASVLLFQHAYRNSQRSEHGEDKSSAEEK